MTAADLVIRELADSEAALQDRLIDLEQDNRILREMLSESLDQLVHLTAHLDTARRTIVSLRAAEHRATSFTAEMPSAIVCQHPSAGHPLVVVQ